MYKKIIKTIVAAILRLEAKLILRKYRPKIIGITGSVGKTSTKEAIAAVMALKYSVRKSEKSYNSEFGIPLTIIGAKTAWGSPLGWLATIWRGLIVIFFHEDYPAWLVLEVGADRPNDIKKVTRWIKFDIAVVTRLPDIPVHIEFFPTRERVVEEKMALPLSLSARGLAILNADDPDSILYRDKIKAPIINYGISSEADYRATNQHFFYHDQEGKKMPAGVACKIEYKENSLPLRVLGTIGYHLLYPQLAAFAVGMSQEINAVEILEAIAGYLPPPGRARLLPGIKNTTIIDDTYNSSPAALEAGLLALYELETAGRKIAVIGDMMELGGYTLEAHQQAGRLASRVANIIITVGLRAKFAYEAAIEENGFPADQIFHFDEASRAGLAIQDLLQEGDVIYLKGSQSIRLEKIVEEIMRNPDQKETLLVRQEPEWQKR